MYCISTLYFIVHSHTDNVKHNCLLRNTRGISLGAVAVHSTELVPNKPKVKPKFWRTPTHTDYNT